jgi:hypothetical protein
VTAAASGSSDPAGAAPEEIMDWIPIVFITFKLSIIGAAMFFSIKSHRDKEKEEQEEERARQERIKGAQAPHAN